MFAFEERGSKLLGQLKKRNEAIASVLFLLFSFGFYASATFPSDFVPYKRGSYGTRKQAGLFVKLKQILDVQNMKNREM